MSQRNELARLVDSVIDPDVEAGPDPAEWRRLSAALEARRAARRWSPAVALAAIAGASVALVWLVLESQPRPQMTRAQPTSGSRGDPITYYVETRPEPDRRVSDDKTHRGASLFFSDGSQVHFDPSGVGRVLSSTETGAVLQLDDGRALFQVNSRPQARWLVRAGPFIIRVTGTKFALSWSSHERQLDLDMKEGSVEVEGPLVEKGTRLVAPQGLSVDLGARTFEMAHAKSPHANSRVAAPRANRPRLARGPQSTVAAQPGMSAIGGPTPTPDDVTVPQAIEAPERAVGNASSPPISLPDTSSSMPPSLDGQGSEVAPGILRPSPISPAAPTWAQEVAAGHFTAVVRHATAEGLDHSLALRSLEDLSALADAARYSDLSDLAVRTLQTIRRRFPDSGEARSSAFLLGRIFEDKKSFVAAVDWFQRYLAEAPTGPYAELALGHKMLVVSQGPDRAQSQRVAHDYLARYPDGTHAHIARGLLEP